MGKIATFKVSWVAAAFMTLGLASCGDDDGLSPQDAAVDGGGMDVAQRLDGPPADGPVGDGPLGDTAAVDGGIDASRDTGSVTSSDAGDDAAF